MRVRFRGVPLQLHQCLPLTTQRRNTLNKGYYSADIVNNYEKKIRNEISDLEELTYTLAIKRDGKYQSVFSDSKKVGFQ